jgi:hypothetical protein
MGVKEIIFLQDESRARVFDVYSMQLIKKIKENKNLEFLNDFLAEPDKFKHSGLACRNNEGRKFIESNAIQSVRKIYFNFQFF